MKLKISYGHTFNRGNYESERIDMGVEVNIPIEEFNKDYNVDEFNDAVNVYFELLKEKVWQKGGKI